MKSKKSLFLLVAAVIMSMVLLASCASDNTYSHFQEITEIGGYNGNHFVLNEEVYTNSYKNESSSIGRWFQTKKSRRDLFEAIKTDPQKDESFVYEMDVDGEAIYIQHFSPKKTEYYAIILTAPFEDGKGTYLLSNFTIPLAADETDTQYMSRKIFAPFSLMKNVSAIVNEEKLTVGREYQLKREVDFAAVLAVSRSLGILEITEREDGADVKYISPYLNHQEDNLSYSFTVRGDKIVFSL